MSFANPQFLWYLPAAIILSFVAYAFTLFQQKKLSEWVDPSLWSSVIPEYKKKILKLKPWRS